MPKIFLMIPIIITTVIFTVKADNNQHIVKDRLPDDFMELNFKEVGSTKFSFLFWDIYNSTLYTKSGVYLPENPALELIFEIAYLKDITAKDLLNKTVEQWQHVGFAEVEYTEFIPMLKAMWPDITSGDTLALLVNNNQSIFYFNDIKIGVIEQPAFSQLFLAIWLSEKTSQPELRTELLGEKVNE